MISAVVLAAGLSTRMGHPKLILPWGATTVIGQVVITLRQAGIEDIVVVTGGARVQVEAVLQDVCESMVRTVFNSRHAEDDMLESLRTGMEMMSERQQAMLVVLGDQPQIEVQVVRALLDAYRAERSSLVIPSYRMRRGHPWIVDRSLWSDLRSTPPGYTMRDFLNAHRDTIRYLPVESASILHDLDTPEEYQKWKTQMP
jgi:molybdenum cofactor cytidylyltransferase